MSRHWMDSEEGLDYALKRKDAEIKLLNAKLEAIRATVVECAFEIEWFASRKIDLAGTTPSGGSWAQVLMDDVAELRRATL